MTMPGWPRTRLHLTDRKPKYDSAGLFFREMGAFKLLAHEEVCALARQFRDRGDIQARNRIVLHNLRLAVAIAKRYQWSHLGLHDLINEGAIGLIRAAEKFDPELGYRFSTYATWWIRQNITRAIMDTGAIIRMPVHVHEWLSKVSGAAAKVAEEKCRVPSAAEVALELGEPEEKVEKAFVLMFRRRTASLEDLVRPDEWGEQAFDSFRPMTDLVGSTPEVITAAKLQLELDHEFLERVVGLVHGLKTEKNRNVAIFLARYGLDGSLQPRTLESVGEQFGLTRERVRQVVDKIHRRLRRKIPSTSGEVLERTFSRMNALAGLAGEAINLPGEMPTGRWPLRSLAHPNEVGSEPAATGYAEEGKMWGKRRFADDHVRFVRQKLEEVKKRGQRGKWEGVLKEFRARFPAVKADVKALQQLYYRKADKELPELPEKGKVPVAPAVGKLASPSRQVLIPAEAGTSPEKTPQQNLSSLGAGVWKMIEDEIATSTARLQDVTGKIEKLTAEGEGLERHISSLKAALEAGRGRRAAGDKGDSSAA